jgi:crotonobetainyl-CoA:carnitine CoA-transferase CaiB-like acyl-CoA transferase
MRLSETPVERRVAGPRLGEHSAEVLRELGCSDDRIAELAAQRVVLTPP